MMNWANKLRLTGKLIINVPDDLLEKLDDKVKELRLTRNALIVQVLLKYLRLPNLFDEAKE